MNSSELIKEISKAADIPVSVVRKTMAVLPEVLHTALSSGEAVTITGFGRFEVKERAARIGRNPKTGESVPIPAQSKPVFTPTKDYSDMFNGD
ncbi:HU family DNA-binding protein [uncultured Amphritea sp.]|uniref:HU family DNA-binding protein n=1 Tax=uncultured Amphritea sp. TaxID=981605 RepID=UPI0026302826|nr:HU family DNA-binding protein [uncultured Amphritea sp.]